MQSPSQLKPLKSCYLNDPSVKATLGFFIEGLRQRVNTIKTLFYENDIEKLQDEIHSLKGSSAAFGFPEIAIHCRNLEHYSSPCEQKAAIGEEIDKISTLYQRALAGWEEKSLNS